MNHNLRRTNSKGERGLFKCLNCGQWGHFPKFEKWDCPAPGDEEIELLLAITGEETKESAGDTEA